MLGVSIVDAVAQRSLGEQVTDPSLAIHDLHEPTAAVIADGGKDPRKRADQDLRHPFRGHLFGRMEHEAPCSELDDRLLLTRLAAYPFVLREDDPASPPCFLEPHLVVGVLREEIVMNDHDRMNLSQSVWDLPPTQAAVDEEVRRRGVPGTALRL
jgi:hypothetical protein